MSGRPVRARYCDGCAAGTQSTASAPSFSQWPTCLRPCGCPGADRYATPADVVQLPAGRRRLRRHRLEMLVLRDAIRLTGLTRTSRHTADMTAGSTRTAGSTCHYVSMSNALGVDHGSKDDSAPFVITGPLPGSVEQNVEFVRQRRVRDEWRARVERGEITHTPSHTPPPGLPPGLSGRPLLVGPQSAWTPCLVGGLPRPRALVRLPPRSGRSVGGHPWRTDGRLVVQLRQEHVRDRDMKLMEANQRKITDPWDRTQMIEAHQAARQCWRSGRTCRWTKEM